MRYSIEPRDIIYVKGYEFLSFAKNTVTNLSNKYSQKILDSAKKSTTDATKTVSKTAIQKTAETTGDLIANKIADKTTKELHSKYNLKESKNEMEIRKQKILSPEQKNRLLMN